MANTYFQFKEFRIDQAQSGMKVTTEGCILGGYTASLAVAPKGILDIGTGTGLLTLMLAQQFLNAKLDAVEIDDLAAQEASMNFKNSPWNERLSLHQKGIQNFDKKKTYDLIISNPPFYQNSMRPIGQSQNMAKHEESLTQQELISAVTQLLDEHGLAVILYPEREMQTLIIQAQEAELFLNRRLTIFNHDKFPVFRVIGVFSKVPSSLIEEKLYIRNPNSAYTTGFVDLLKSYYLHL